MIWKTGFLHSKQNQASNPLGRFGRLVLPRWRPACQWFCHRGAGMRCRGCFGSLAGGAHLSGDTPALPTANAHTSTPPPAGHLGSRVLRQMGAAGQLRRRTHARTLPRPRPEAAAAAAGDDDDVRCEACGSGEAAPELMLCDGCDRGFHIFCLRPILPRVPAGNWYCPSCRSPASSKSQSAAASAGVQSCCPLADSDRCCGAAAELLPCLARCCGAAAELLPVKQII
jgi:hypothetical protein